MARQKNLRWYRANCMVFRDGYGLPFCQHYLCYTKQEAIALFKEGIQYPQTYSNFTMVKMGTHKAYMERFGVDGQFDLDIEVATPYDVD